MPKLYALGFALLGVWGAFTAVRLFKPTGPWAAQRRLIFLVDVIFGGSCFVCTAALWLGWFRAWMLVPLGASYLAMIPLPCYFEAVGRIGWLHVARNVLYVVVAVSCFATAAGLLSLSWFGL